MSEVEVKSTSFAGWDCVKVSNGLMELIVPEEIGPRIVKFGFIDEKNEFALKEDQKGKTGGDEWRLYGGHRLWHSPEHETRTYIPDNEPVDIEKKDDGIKITQPTEEGTQIQKVIDICMDPAEEIVAVDHKLINRGEGAIELAPWSLSVMDSGGVAVLPLERGDPNALLPDRSVSFWPYSRMDDPRIKMGKDHVFLSQDSDMEDPFKTGALVEEEWAAYVNDGHAFVKYFDYKKDAEYPDLGCTVEAYTDDFMLELETLGPIENIRPGESAEHVETWKLIDVGEITPTDEEEISKKLLPEIKE